MDLLVEFFKHNAMMNQRLMEACRGLSSEQLGATATGTYGSIGATLVHIANAQSSYAVRLMDTDRPDRLPEDPFPDWETLVDRLVQSDAQLEQAATHVSAGNHPPK